MKTDDYYMDRCEYLDGLGVKLIKKGKEENEVHKGKEDKDKDSSKGETIFKFKSEMMKNLNEMHSFEGTNSNVHYLKGNARSMLVTVLKSITKQKS